MVFGHIWEKQDRKKTRISTNFTQCLKLAIRSCKIIKRIDSLCWQFCLVNRSQSPPCYVDKGNSNAANSNQGMYIANIECLTNVRPECSENQAITKKSIVLSRIFPEAFSSESYTTACILCYFRITNFIYWHFHKTFIALLYVLNFVH